MVKPKEGERIQCADQPQSGTTATSKGNRHFEGVGFHLWEGKREGREEKFTPHRMNLSNIRLERSEGQKRGSHKSWKGEAGDQKATL